MSPRTDRHTLLAATLAILFAGCGPDAAKTETPSRAPDTARKGGSGGASESGAGGNMGNGNPGNSGAGGSTSGAGGAGGSAPSSPMGSDAGAPAAPVGPVVSLPVIVTRHFDNQGWFASPALEMKFTPGSTIIRHGVSTAGQCGPGRRMPAPKGDCLKVTYTPPADTVAPDGGGWVGVFLLTTLLDPSVIGQPNWGISGESGKNIAPGATKISFVAASDTEGQQVVFKAGTKSDSFVIQDVPQMLGTGWKDYSVSLEGQAYGSNVFGGFAWVLTDITKPATFYIDGIVWE